MQKQSIFGIELIKNLNMALYRVRSSFLGFDRSFNALDEIEFFVNTHFSEKLINSNEIREHFVDKNVPFFGVKGIIITCESQEKQEANKLREDDKEEMI